MGDDTRWQRTMGPTPQAATDTAFRLQVRHWVGMAINVAGLFGAAHVLPPMP